MMFRRRQLERKKKLEAAKKAAAEVSAQPPEVPPAPPADLPNLSEMKVHELKKLAEEKGVEGYEKMKKDELIAALSE